MMGGGRDLLGVAELAPVAIAGEGKLTRTEFAIRAESYLAETGPVVVGLTMTPWA
jgi:hypothetical protein